MKKVRSNEVIVHLIEPRKLKYDDITHALAYGYSSGAVPGLTHHQALINFKESGHLDNISLIEEKMYTKEEVEEKMRLAYIYGQAADHVQHFTIREDWIKENL
jgi:hypothetical protein